MNLSTIKAPKNSRANKKRVGRGMGSGMGKTSTRGHKGQRSRSGSRMMRGFEGGQMPLHRRVPKRGFNNIFRQEYQIVNLETIALLGEKEITPEVLQLAGVIRKASEPVKILGDGELRSAITVRAHKFSKSAEEKIVAAGGKIEVLGHLDASLTTVNTWPAAKPAKERKSSSERKAVSDARAEAKAKAEADAKPEAKADAKPEAKAKADAKPEAKAEAKAEKPAAEKKNKKK